MCTVLTDDFLNYSFKKGNDLITPVPEFNFPGLKAGNKWCLCAPRWQEALVGGFAPKVLLASTNIKSLEYIDLEDLKKFALDLS